MQRARNSRPLILILASLALILAGACSGSSEGGSSPDATSAPASSVPLSDRKLPGSEVLLLSEGPTLYRVDASGQQPLIQLDSGAYILDPVVGGSQVAFAIQPPAATTADGRPDFGSDLYVAPRGGGQLRLLVKHAVPGEFVRGPAWLPDGQHLLYDVRTPTANGGADLRLEVIDIRTGERSRFFAGGLSPVISPDGRLVACVWVDPGTGQEDVVVLDLGTRQVRRVLGQNSTKLNISSVAWSPDNSKLVFAAADPFVAATGSRFPGALSHPTLRDIWIVNIDGSGLHRLTDLADNQPSALWSADGSHIYVLATRGFLRISVADAREESLGEGSLGGQITPLTAR